MTLTAQQIYWLNSVPTRVLWTAVVDYALDDNAVMFTSSIMKAAQPLDVLDYAFARIREKVANRAAQP